MAQKRKKKTLPSPKKKTENARSKALKAEKEEPIDWKAIARDERTHKIIGAVSLLISIFLFVAFISYFFTWQKDQSQVWNHSIFSANKSIKNLLGVLGAFASDFFIYK